MALIVVAPTQHALELLTVGKSQRRMICSCGWQTEPQDDPESVRRMGRMHLEEARQHRFHSSWFTTGSGKLRLLRRGGEDGNWFWMDGWPG